VSTESASGFAGVPDAFERLWTPHRMVYIGGTDKPADDTPRECPFCRSPRRADADGLVVARGVAAYVVLNRYPYNPGHLLVCPYRHVPDFADLTEEEATEVTRMTQQSMRVLRAVSHPAGFNLGMNQGEVAGAGIAAHLHQHVVPRWQGDSNFLPGVARTKALPQLLGETRGLLADAWPRVGACPSPTLGRMVDSATPDTLGADAARSGPAVASRPDASMDLLHVLRREALDPAYLDAAARPGGPGHRPPVVWVSALAVGLLLGVGVGGAFRAAPAPAEQRAELIARIESAEATHDALGARVDELARSNAELEAQAGVLAPETRARRDALAARTGAVAVRGPGLRLTIEDGPDDTVRGARVVDTDLRLVANSLWASGAEAQGINGHRLTTRTPIRNAGDAVTVDYRSLTAPYLVEAIGDPDALAEAFAASEGGQWLTGLSEHYQITWRMERVDDLTLGADPGLGVDRAEPGR